jgi:hypothetical protein
MREKVAKKGAVKRVAMRKGAAAAAAPASSTAAPRQQRPDAQNGKRECFD